MSGTLPEPWLGVEPRHLATFVAVADAGSFRGAAARIGYVQSAVSQQIAQLERAIDRRLIERGQGNRDVVLTPAGRTLLAHARRIVSLVRAASADLRDVAGDEPLRVAVEPAGISLVPSLLQHLRAISPGVRLAISEVPAADQPELIRSGAVDLGVGAFTEPLSGLGRHVLAIDRWVLAAPEGSPLARHASLSSFSALSGVRLFETPSQPPPIARAHIGGGQVISCDRLAIVVELVSAGCGCAIVPASSLDPERGDVVIVELGDLTPARVISAIWHRARQRPTIVRALDMPEGTAPQAADEAMAVV